MPRGPRIDIQGMVYHVFSRGHNKSALFLDDEDRFVFLKHLRRAQEQSPWLNLGYSLMSNHYHLQAKTLQFPLGKTMHLLNTLYAGHFNYRYKKIGHVFQNRYHSIPVQTDRYLLALSRYIHLNSVHAGIVAKPEDYPWSSYQDYLRPQRVSWVHTDLVLQTLSAQTFNQHDRYREFVESGISLKPEFTEEILWKTRFLGDDHFAKYLRSQRPDAFALRHPKLLENAI